MIGLEMRAWAIIERKEKLQSHFDKFEIKIIGVHARADGLYVSAVDNIGKLHELKSEQVRDIENFFRPKTIPQRELK